MCDDQIAMNGRSRPRQCVKIAVVEQRPRHERNAVRFEHIFGDIAATQFQNRDIWCPFEDIGYVEQVGLQAVSWAIAGKCSFQPSTID
jgi:hypothetical protein